MWSVIKNVYKKKNNRKFNMVKNSNFTLKNQSYSWDNIRLRLLIWLDYKLQLFHLIVCYLNNHIYMQNKTKQINLLCGQAAEDVKLF